MSTKHSLNGKHKFFCDSPKILTTGQHESIRHAIGMHPSTMKKLQFMRGRSLLVCSENGQMLLQCVPDLSAQQSSIIIAPSNIFQENLKGTVVIEKNNLGINHADRVILSFDNYKSFISCPSFKKIVQDKLNKSNIREDLTFCVSYLGYRCHFTVMKVVDYVSDKIINQVSLHDVSLHDESISSLDISKDNSILKNSVDESSITCSTPISSKSKVSSNVLFQNMKLDKIEKNVCCKQQFYRVTNNTKILVRKKDIKVQINFQHLVGKQISEIKSLMALYSEGEDNCGLLFSGASGTGKSIMVQALECEFDFPVFDLKEFTNGRTGTVLRNQLEKLFKEAVDSSPSIIFLDDIDSFCTNLKNSSLQNNRKIIHLLSNLIQDTLNSKDVVIVIGAACDISAVDVALRKPGTLEKEIHFEIPSADDRKEILSKILENRSHSLSPKQVSEIAGMAHGFTGGDLKTVCENATISEYRRTDGNNTCISFEELQNVMKEVKPKSVAEFTLEIPNVKWSDIGGMHSIKTAITEMVDWPLKHAEQLKKFRITPSKGILLYGPPGCSKTMIAKALVTESHLNFISIKGPELFNKYVGESERLVSQLFKKARSAAPCVLFFDEFDSLASIRDSATGTSDVAKRVSNMLLVEMDGIDVFNGVSIMAATNRPDLIDPSFLRPGRFNKMIYVPIPDAAARKEIFEVTQRRRQLASDVDMSYLIKATDGYTGAEISELGNVAAKCAFDDYVKGVIKETVVGMDHFLAALKSVLPRTSQEMIAFYENYNKR